MKQRIMVKHLERDRGTEGGEGREKESERGERRCEGRGKSIIRFRMEKIMQCNNLIVHMFHVYVHSYIFIHGACVYQWS